MDIERTMEFILKQQAKSEARFEASQEHSRREMAEIRRVLAQNNRIVTKLAQTGVALRSDIRRHEVWMKKHELTMNEIEEKLNALVDIVDKQTKRNGAK